MARPVSTYRAARRNAARAQRRIWREGRMISGDKRGGFRYGWHASMPQAGRNGLPAQRAAAA